MISLCFFRHTSHKTKMKQINSILDITLMKFVIPFCGIILPGLEKQVYFPKIIMPFFKGVSYLTASLLLLYAGKVLDKIKNYTGFLFSIKYWSSNLHTSSKFHSNFISLFECFELRNCFSQSISPYNL